MNNVIVPEFDVFRWIGAIAVIFENLVQEELFGVCSAAIALCAACLIFYRLTCYRGDD